MNDVKEVRKFHTEDPQILDATIKNSVTPGDLLPEISASLCYIMSLC
jgi:hypothetical protein